MQTIKDKAWEVKDRKKYSEENRRGIDPFLTANQFNNSVNGETQRVWGRVNGMGLGSL